MEAPLTLRRPNNWQDFETLCKKLWGEIWNCPEIKKNGRNGQIQHGVDICGIPFGENSYYGIQCKGKDEYTHKQFKEDEINREIEKAMLFQPTLKKLYFATTTTKDVSIEEFVRKKNLENIAKEFFEVHIFSWEDIVELIDENKQTHDWYVKSQNFKTNKNVAITFQNNLSEIIITPKFKRVVNRYIQKPPRGDAYRDPLEAIIRQQKIYSDTVHTPMSSTKINLSYSRLQFKIHNIGIDPIEEYKIFFQFNGEIQDILESNETHTGLASIRFSNHYISNVTLYKEPMSGKVIPRKKILVGDDVFTSDSIYLKPFSKEYEIPVKWKLISKDFKTDGNLKIVVNPQFERGIKEFCVDDPSEVRIENSGILEDVIIVKKEE